MSVKVDGSLNMVMTLVNYRGDNTVIYQNVSISD